MMRLRSADDRCGDAGTGRNPRQGDLGPRHAALFGHLLHGLDDRAVGILGGLVQRTPEDVALLARAALVPIARESPACQRAPWQHGDLLVFAERDHLALFLALEEVVVVLH